MTQNCIFCRIEKGEVKAEMVYQNERVVAFRDQSPKAPIHILIVPRKHLRNTNEIDASDIELLGAMILAASSIGADMGLKDSGYRLIFNTGPDSGQVVDHLHLHLLGGKKLGDLVGN